MGGVIKFAIQYIYEGQLIPEWGATSTAYIAYLSEAVRPLENKAPYFAF